MARQPKSAPPEMINAKPRFAVEGDQVFAYDSGKYLPIAGSEPYVSKDGFVFDLAKVAQCIRDGKFLEEAIVDRVAGMPPKVKAEETTPFTDVMNETAYGKSPKTPVAPKAAFGKPLK